MNFLIKKLLAPKGMEYLTIAQDLTIEDMSFGVKRFADSAHEVEIGQDCRRGFPELVGMENLLMQVLWGWNSSLELKGISRPHTIPLYVDIYIMGGQDQPNRINHNLIIFFEDVTEQMLLEQTLVQRSHEAALLLNSLSATKDYLQKIITAIADALIVTTRSGQIKTVNPAAQILFGYSEQELINQPISLIMTSQILPEILVQSLAKDIPPENWRDDLPPIEVVCHRSDRSEVTVAFSCSTIQTEVDCIQDLVYIGRDITDQIEIKQNLKLAQIRAEEASKSKSLFLANMSHEIRTPMNGVLGLTELLINTDLDPRQRDFTEGIKTSGKNLLRIINEILDFSKLEAGKVAIEVYEFDLRNCIEDVVDLLTPLAHTKGLEITCMIHPNLPMSVWGDGTRLGQILTNFLSNAIKFTATGEILIEARPFDYSNHLSNQTGVIFAVIDQGIGISAETINTLFTPFTQADNSTTRKYGGTGLGLAICKQLTTLMGGEIGVESTVGEGSRFWVSLPLESDRSFLLENSDQLAGYSLLVVDRHVTTREAISIYAHHWGMRVETASTKEQALELLSSNQIDLVISELELLDSSFNCQPLIVTTRINQAIKKLNPASNQLFEQAIAPACEFVFLSKPLHLPRLLKAIQNLLKIEPSSPSTLIASTPPQLGLNILLAEDNVINQKVATTLLKGLGHRVDVAINGEEVLWQWESNNYDIIFMDCQMPVLDGFAATAKIRQLEGSDRHTVIIAVTANAMKEDKAQCLTAGMDDYLSKPFYKVEIEAMIDKWSKS